MKKVQEKTVAPPKKDRRTWAEKMADEAAVSSVIDLDCPPKGSKAYIWLLTLWIFFSTIGSKNNARESLMKKVRPTRRRFQIIRFRTCLIDDLSALSLVEIARDRGVIEKSSRHANRQDVLSFASAIRKSDELLHSFHAEVCSRARKGKGFLKEYGYLVGLAAPAKEEHFFPPGHRCYPSIDISGSSVRTSDYWNAAMKDKFWYDKDSILLVVE